MDFYKRVFDTTELVRMAGPDGAGSRTRRSKLEIPA
jgi:hypothetical protein